MVPAVAGNRVGSDNMGVRIYNMCLRIALGSRKEFREELLSHREREILPRASTYTSAFKHDQISLSTHTHSQTRLKFVLFFFLFFYK